MKNYDFKLNGRIFSSEKVILSKEELLKVVGIDTPENFDLYFDLGEKTFEPVGEGEKVDLTKPGRENFRVEFRKELVIEIDDENYTIEDCVQSPNELLKLHSLHPNSYYLKQLRRNRQITYKNDGDYPIVLENGMKFISCKNEPTVVS